MSKTFRLGSAALNQTPLAWESNRRNIRLALDAARQNYVAVLCLPELCISGYGCEDMFLAAGVRATAAEILAELIPETHGLVTALGLPIEWREDVYNAVAVACDGKLVGVVCKQFLAGDGIHYEPRWFRRWPGGFVDSVQLAGSTVPMGDLVFHCGDLAIGFEICRDAWVHCRPGAQLAARGAQVLLNPSASHFAFGKQAVRVNFVLQASRDYGVSYAYANLLGNEAGRAIYDGGALIASDGKMVARGPRFSLADVVLTCVEVQSSPSDADADLAASVRTPFEIPPVGQAAGIAETVALVAQPGGAALRAGTPAGHPEWEASEHLKREEFSRAVPLALFDYLRKSSARGFVVSLSGGADSSAVAVLVHLMMQWAAAELDAAAIATKLAGVHFPPTPGEDAAERTAHRVPLACIYQSTENSSLTTCDAARAVAEAVGAEFFEWSVQQPVQQFVQVVAEAVGRELSWEHDDLALQNIQARARGPAAWLLANLRGALLLATSNRSEAAVGYATMDGDTCGGLAPIAGIDKAFLRDWLEWMENQGPTGLAPLPILHVVTQQEPTAELRPAAAGQTDERDLMPYRVLDAIERAAIRDKQMPLQVLQTIQQQFEEFSSTQLAEWIERFFRLWCRNQWKRERYAPSFHLDDENLDPKTWCRFPILSGNFERELEELRKQVDSS